MQNVPQKNTYEIPWKKNLTVFSQKLLDIVHNCYYTLLLLYIRFLKSQMKFLDIVQNNNQESSVYATDYI